MNTARTIDVVAGGGHAGLAMSRLLAERAIPHVVLERRKSTFIHGAEDGARTGR